MRYLIPMTLSLLLFSGCSLGYQVMKEDMPPPQERLVTERNYQTGDEMSAHIGEPLVRVREHYEVKYATDSYMRPSSDSKLTGGLVNVEGSKTRKYRVRGVVTVKGQELFVVPAYTGEKRLLIRKDGRPFEQAMSENTFNRDHYIIVYTLKPEPPDLKFTHEYEYEEKQETREGCLNFELIYSGTDGKSLFIMYREYTPNDMARPAFFQNLTFMANKNPIRYKNFLIDITKATNEQIIYKVIQDQ